MAVDAHPELGKRSRPALRVAEIVQLPILTKTKPFLAMNESTVCTAELTDEGEAKRGAVALGMSRHDLPHGFVVFQSIEEAEAIVALLNIAIVDAKRIEAGLVPFAREGIAPPVKQ